MELDDDYNSFDYRRPIGDSLKGYPIKQLDRLFEGMIEFLNTSGATTVAFAQAGDFIGGLKGGNYKKGLLRKAMNTFFCDIEKPFQFVGRINEDVNTYVTEGGRGKMFFSVVTASIVQTETQKNKGGMSTVYLDSGTYLKSFYTVIMSPSCVKIGLMGATNKRIHHQVSWDYAVPKILNERYRKYEGV